MLRILAFCSLGLLAACAEREPIEVSADDEAQLAAELRDYAQAGAPAACVDTRDLRGNRSVGDAAIIFGGQGRRVWVNRPAGGCPSLDYGRALQTRTPSTRLCRGDIANVFDPVSGMSFGSCGLGDFTPYERRRNAG